MVNKKVTGKKAAGAASKILKNKATGSKSKSAAGSALSQRKAPKKQTSCEWLLKTADIWCSRLIALFHPHFQLTAAAML